MNKKNLSNQNDGAILERSFSFCNESMHTISLQVRRLQSIEPEDSKFVFRQWADFRFLILSLDRLYKSSGIALNVKNISKDVEKARNEFRRSLPFLKKLRNIGEHLDSYSMDNGHLTNISRGELQIGTWKQDGTWFSWLGEEIDIIECEKAAIKLFKKMRDIKNEFKKLQNSD